MIRFLTFICVALCFALPSQAEIRIQQVTSPGGIKAWLVEENSIPFVALDIQFQGGTSLDLEGKGGATYLMAGLLEEGTGDLDSTEFLEAREAIAAQFGFRARGDGVTISAEFLNEFRDESVALLRMAIQEPNFDNAALERVRSQVISIITSNAKDPQDIASITFDQLAFGDHPYGRPSEGTIETVNLLTQDDMRVAHKNSMSKDRVYVGAVGDISAQELGLLLDELLGGLPETGAPMASRVKAKVEGGVTVIEHPTPQSVAIFGHAGIKRDDPDFYAFFVMNHIFGGSGFTSRLTDEVREKRGLTYGVYSYVATYDLAELFLGSVSSANDRIAEAIDVIRDEWAKLAKEGVTAEELEAAQRYLTGAYPLRFDGNARIASILAVMQIQDLGPEYLAVRNDIINAVTVDDIKRAAAKFVKPENFHVVVVGQPEGLESTE